MISVRYLSLQILPSWYTRRIRSLHVSCSLPLLDSTNKAGEANRLFGRYLIWGTACLSDLLVLCYGCCFDLEGGHHSS